MSFTYSGDPDASPKDAVRWEIQDTEERGHLLEDEEIMSAIAREAGSEVTEQGLLSAAARCAEVLARKFLRQIDIVEGSLQQTYSKQAKTYTEMAKELRIRAQGAQAPFAGGQTISGKQSLRSDTDRVQPRFRRGQNDMQRNRGSFESFPGETGVGGN